MILLASVAYGAGGMVSGTVKDPSGAPMKAVFVRARSASKRRITISVLSDKQGQYRFESLAPGDYEVWTSAIGYKSDPPVSVTVAEGKSVPADFALQKGMVRWNELSNHQAGKLLPEGKGKAPLFGQCLICHGFQSRMAATRRDEEGWTRAVKFMQESMHFNLGGRFTDQHATETISYLNSTFGVDSDLPRSPEELPGHKDTVRPWSDEATRIVYVDYDLPKPNSFPFSGAPDKDGKIWIPEFGRANRIARLDPNSGEIQEFQVPFQGSAGVHSAIPAPDGTVWLAEQGSNRVGKWDPRTQTITEFQATYEPGKEGTLIGGSKHTSRVDSKGNVWSSGYPLTRLDPKTGKFTYYPEMKSTYSVAVDRDDTVWFAANVPANTIGKVNAKTGKLTTYVVPTKGYLRRIELDSQGIVWIGEYGAGKIGRFDPKTETFKEYALPGPDPTPYSLGIDKNGHIWYSSHNMDVLGRLDPATGQVTEYPAPYPENTMKEFIMDSQGRMWWGSPPNNKVGYFTLAGNGNQ